MTPSTCISMSSADASTHTCIKTWKGLLSIKWCQPKSLKYIQERRNYLIHMKLENVVKTQ